MAALVMGKVNIQFFKSSILETLKVSVMTLFIMIGAALFGRFISLSLMPRKIIDSLGPLIEYPVFLLIIIIAIYFVLFMFLEGAAVIVMTVPILMPLVVAMNVDVIWFGILLSMICTLGLLTPPVGLSVYAVAGVTKIPMEKLFRTSMVFAGVACLIVGGLLIIFPSIATWLPSTMK
jgi:TRAP-type C4-dicarboxylate transport system permease large subunit